MLEAAQTWTHSLFPISQEAGRRIYPANSLGAHMPFLDPAEREREQWNMVQQ